MEANEKDFNGDNGVEVNNREKSSGNAGSESRIKMIGRSVSAVLQ